MKIFLANPLSLKYREIEKVLLYFGFEKASQKGSHVKFRHAKLTKNLIVPVHGFECKGVYKSEAARIVIKHLL